MNPAAKALDEITEAMRLENRTKKALGPVTEEDRAIYDESQSPKALTSNGVGSPLPCESNKGVPTIPKMSYMNNEKKKAVNNWVDKLKENGQHEFLSGLTFN